MQSRVMPPVESTRLGHRQGGAVPALGDRSSPGTSSTADTLASTRA